MRVVCCGLDFEAKNGVVALKTFRQLLNAKEPVHLTYVGDISAAWRKRFASVLREIEHHAYLPRAQVLSLFRSSHVLFHPALMESYGMVLVEAAAAGMAIVAARRPRVSLSREFLAPDGGPLLDPAKVRPRDEPRWFSSAIAALCRDTIRSKAMARRNWERTATGEFSLVRRNKLVTQFLKTTGKNTAGVGLSLRDLQGRDRIRLVSLTATAFATKYRRYLEKIGLADRRLIV
jgi:glycosyltransferase involved in cell wall biosynthesis